MVLYLGRSGKSRMEIGAEPAIIEAWRGDRVVEGAALEKRCPACGTVGSNPTLSAGGYEERC